MYIKPDVNIIIYLYSSFLDDLCEPSHLEWAEAQSGQFVDKASILQIHSDDFVCLSDCCAEAAALMALAGGIRKGQSDGNLDSVFANTVSRYWFCLEIFKEEAFMSEAQDGREVQRGHWDSWSAANVDLAQSEDLSLAGEGCQFRKHFYGHGRWWVDLLIWHTYINQSQTQVVFQRMVIWVCFKKWSQFINKW